MVSTYKDKPSGALLAINARWISYAHTAAAYSQSLALLPPTRRVAATFVAVIARPCSIQLIVRLVGHSRLPQRPGPRPKAALPQDRQE